MTRVPPSDTLVGPSAHPVNVGRGERLLSLIGGGLLAARGWRRSTVAGAALMLAGTALAARGLTGHCPIRRRMEDAKATADKRDFHPRHPGDIFSSAENKDPIEEASHESFPASDPPAFSPGVASTRP